MALKKLKYETPEQLKAAVDAYFESLKAPLLDKEGRAVQDEQGRPIMIENGKPCTFTGLALALGLTRKGLLGYGARGEFGRIVELAKTRCEALTEEKLYGRSAAGARFSLQNNYGWRERTEVEQTVANRAGENFRISALSDEELERQLLALGYRPCGKEPHGG